MYKPDAFFGVMIAFIALIVLSSIMLLIVMKSPQKEENKPSKRRLPLFKISLVLSIVIGIFASFITGDYLKKGDYSTKKCDECRESASYKVKTNSIVYFYCDNHYDDAVRRYGQYDNYLKEKKANEHPCAICGKTEGTKQINNNQIGGQWDENWYCTKHYADAWQYYYGK